MKSIEFIGAPGSGKTYYENKIKNFLNKKNIKILNYDDLFFTNYPYYKEINILKKTKFFLKKKLINKKNLFIKYINYTFDKFFNFNTEYDKINNNLYTRKFLKLYFKKLKLEKENTNLINKLKKWLKVELASIKIAKKIKSNKKLLINSEGINQRIARLILELSEKKINNFLKKFNYSKFQSDILIFIDTKPNVCINRLKKINNNKYTKKEIKKFYIKTKYIYKNSKQKKFIISKKKDYKKIKKLIHEYITY